MQLATASLDCDRFDYVHGSWLFWSEHHSGQSSRGYQRLSFYVDVLRFRPGVLSVRPGVSSGTWDDLSDSAKEVYRAWAERESVDCEYDQLRYVLEQEDWDVEDDGCIVELLERYDHSDPAESGLCNYDRSDWVNLDMPYTRDLIRFYDMHEDDVLAWCDRACEAYGFTQRAQLWESETIEDPDDLKASLVNHAMTWCAREALAVLGA